MRDYAELQKELRCNGQDCGFCVQAIPSARNCVRRKGADAIEELLAFAQSVARRAVDAQDDEVSAEVLCRKLYKLGIVEKDGAWWHYEPPKGGNHDN